MRRYVISLSILLICSTMASSGELEKNGFSIFLPNGWIEIPRASIDTYEKGIAELSPKLPAQQFDYGFQLGLSKNWFEYPYILVQIKNTGRLTESQLEKLGEYLSQERLDEHKKEVRSVMSLEAGAMAYDKQTNIIWLRVEFDVANTGPILGISGMVPTETGFILMAGYSLKEDYPIYDAIFQSVALSISPGPGIAYQPKWSDNLPPVDTGMDWVN